MHPKMKIIEFSANYKWTAKILIINSPNHSILLPLCGLDGDKIKAKIEKFARLGKMLCTKQIISLT